MIKLYAKYTFVTSFVHSTIMYQRITFTFPLPAFWLSLIDVNDNRGIRGHWAHYYTEVFATICRLATIYLW